MVVMTALFMMPTELLLPTLLRLANTPPVSSSVARGQHRVVHKPAPDKGNEISKHEELLLKQEADFQRVLNQGRHYCESGNLCKGDRRVAHRCI